MKLPHVPATLLLAASLTSLPLLAQDAKEQHKPAKTEARADAKADAKADEAAEMKAWMDYATPGEAHKKLAEMAGSWTAHVKMWPAPGAPAQESDATAEFTPILGGRYLEESFKGTAMGQPFEGRGWIAYDNLLKKYVSTWIDNMGTGIMTSTGTADASGKVVTTTGMADHPAAGKEVPMKSVMTHSEPDHMLFEMWGPDRSGKPYKSLEITYTRKK